MSQIQSAGTNYLSNIVYNPAHAPTSLSYGTNTAQATIGYNARLQLQALAYTYSGGSFSLTYNYGAGNNGQIQSITDNMDATRATSYTYDAWARVKTASNSQWSLNWEYDRYGNRKAQNGNYSMQVVVDPATNRVTTIGSVSTLHDAAGNLTKDDQRRYVYDAENRTVKLRDLADTTDLATYSYDGNGLRVRKVSGGMTTVYMFSATKVIAEYENGVAPASPTVCWFCGRLLARDLGMPA